MVLNVPGLSNGVVEKVSMPLLDAAGRSDHGMHDALLDVAEQLFRHIGHRKTTIEDIAAEVGKSRASVYRFFPTRGSINHGVYARWAQRELDVLDQDAEMATSASIRVAHVLTRLNGRARERVICQPNVHALWVAAALEDWPVHHGYFRTLTTGFATIMGRDEGTSHLQGSSAFYMAQGIVTAMMAHLHPVLLEERMKRQKDAEADLKAHIAFVLKALNPPCLGGTCGR